MVDKNDALLREVEEELRREQWAKLWDRYGTYLLAAAGVLIALVGGFKYWEAQQQSRAEQAGSAYNSAMKLFAAGKADEGNKKLDELVADGPGGYPALAELQKAGALLKANRPADAQAMFEKLATDQRAPELMRGFAAIQSATLRLGEADFTEMQNRLNPLAGEDKPWRHHARELLGLAAIKAGRLDDARASLGSLLGDPQAPSAVLERARVLLGSIAASELAVPAAPAPAGPAPAAPAASAPDAGAPGGDVKPK